MALVPPPQASPDEIKQQFRRLALQHHPDKAGSPERFQAIREAFEVLKDPERRFHYDKTLLHCLDMQVGPGTNVHVCAALPRCALSERWPWHLSQPWD